MECVVHFHDANRTFSKLEPLTKNKYLKILEAKKIRQGESLPCNNHYQQCRTIPSQEELDIQKHGVHLNPCYAKFTQILAPSRKRHKTEPSVDIISPRIKRRKLSDSNTGLFPKYCLTDRIPKTSRKKAETFSGTRWNPNQVPFRVTGFVSRETGSKFSKTGPPFEKAGYSIRIKRGSKLCRK